MRRGCSSNAHAGRDMSKTDVKNVCKASRYEAPDTNTAKARDGGRIRASKQQGQHHRFGRRRRRRDAERTESPRRDSTRLLQQVTCQHDSYQHITPTVSCQRMPGERQRPTNPWRTAETHEPKIQDTMLLHPCSIVNLYSCLVNIPKTTARTGIPGTHHDATPWKPRATPPRRRRR